VKSGSALMTWKEYDGVPIALYQAGDIFGDLEVYKNSKRLFSVMSITELTVLVLNKRDFKNIFFRKAPFLGNRFLWEMERKFLFLERVMQMIVDCVFHGKNIFDLQGSIVDFDRQGSLLKVEDRNNYLHNFLRSYHSRLMNSLILRFKNE
jgi:CRP-like cAMP-binding protein